MTMSIKQQEQLNFLMSLKTGLPDYSKQFKAVNDQAQKRFDAEMLANVKYMWQVLQKQNDIEIDYFEHNKAKGLEFAYKNEFIAKFLTAVYTMLADKFTVSDNLHANLALSLRMNESQYFLFLNKVIDFWGNILIASEVSYFERKNDREMTILPVNVNYAVEKALKKIKIYHITETDFSNRFKALNSNYQEMILADLTTIGKAIGRPVKTEA